MRAALAFLTPLGGARAPDGRALAWFPLVGALLGAALGALWWGAAQVWPPAVAAAVVVAADLALTGMLHVDGLADTADGLLPHLPRERRLAVMAEPTVGAFGVAVLVAVLLLRFAALASMPAQVGLLAALWCASRALMAVAVRTVPYARARGLVTAFAGGDWRPVAASGAVLALLAAVAAARPVAAMAAVLAAAVAGTLVVVAARARLGGCTGDVLGAAGVLAETTGLVVAAARW